MVTSSKQPWLNTLTGTQIRIKTSGSETDNRLAIVEYIEKPHSTPPVFTRHEFVEVFCVQSGELTFQFLDEPCFVVVAGEQVVCPSWKPHSFWNETAMPVEVLLICTPAGLDEFFIESNKLLKRHTTAGEHSEFLDAAMKSLRMQYGLEHVGKAPARPC